MHDDRHAVAALCLYQQPFGFTQEDVDALRGVADLGDRKATDLASLPYAYSDLARRHIVEQAAVVSDRLRSLAARIAALLPPSS
jgi:hypothetical protein